MPWTGAWITDLSNYPEHTSSRAEIDQFITRSQTHTPARKTRPRLLFACDATASRQPTWDRACQLQGRMFLATRDLGGLQVQLCYYRGFAEMRASAWLQEETGLLQLMSQVRCAGGYTQIERLLNHALRDHARGPIRALVFLGDAVEESVDALCGKAGECGLKQLPLFMFQEGHDPMVEQCFRTMARVSTGAYARFDHNSPQQFADLLGAVASYAAAGTAGLLRYGKSDGRAEAGRLLKQLQGES